MKNMKEPSLINFYIRFLLCLLSGGETYSLSNFILAVKEYCFVIFKQAQ